MVEIVEMVIEKKLTARIFLNPSENYREFYKILCNTLNGYTWKFESQKPQLYSSPAILVPREQKQEILKKLKTNKLVCEN